MSTHLRPPILWDCGDLTFQYVRSNVTSKRLPTLDTTRVLSNADFQDLEDLLDDAEFESVVYLTGVTEQGYSVMAVIEGFEPWFYIICPDDWTETRLKGLADELSQLCRCHITAKVERKYTFTGWEPKSVEEPNELKAFRCLRLSFPTNMHMRTALKRIKEQQLSCQPRTELRVCEDSVQISQKFMQFRNLLASGWVTIPQGAFRTVHPTERSSACQIEVTARVEDVHYNDMDEIAPMLSVCFDIEAQSGNFRTMPEPYNGGDCISYLGSTFYRHGTTEPVLRVMQVLGDVEETKFTEGIVFESYRTEKELLMAWWDLIVNKADPDFIITFNGEHFDFKYIYHRWLFLGGDYRFMNINRLFAERRPFKEDTFKSSARGTNPRTRFNLVDRGQVDLYLYCKANYKLDQYTLDVVSKTFLPQGKRGKVILDFPGWVQDEVRELQPHLYQVCDILRAHTNPEKVEECQQLASRVVDLVVSLEDAKEVEDDEDGTKWQPVHLMLLKFKDTATLALDGVEIADEVRTQLTDLFKLMDPALDASGSNNYYKTFRLFVRGARERGYVGKYCQVDCDLLAYLLDTLSVIPDLIKVSQETFTEVDDVANRGQQIKVYNLIYRFCNRLGYVLNKEDVGWDTTAEYQGATVIDPTPGYYTQKIGTLDFASLYPSIIRGHNLCHSALILNPAVLAQLDAYKANGARFESYDLGGKTWVFQQHRKAILPMILEQLLDARKAVRRRMKDFPKGSDRWKLLNSSQKAKKVTCNSVYGFCGINEEQGMLPCMPIANATTFIGRSMIEETKAYCEAQGYEVIYGDTDSVMVNLGDRSMEECFEIATRLGEGATQLFPDSVLLEFEKVFCPYLLIKKKMYAGVKYEDDPNDPPTLDVKGLALARRDNCALVRSTMKGVLISVMQEGDPQKAYQLVEDKLDQLHRGEIPVEELTITKQLKSEEEYANDRQPHLTVVKRMKARKAMDIPEVGERVPFAVVWDQGTDQMYTQTEHPKYIKAEGLRINDNYYIEKQFAHIKRIMEALPVPSPEKLFKKAMDRATRKRHRMKSLFEAPTGEEKPKRRRRVHAPAKTAGPPPKVKTVKRRASSLFSVTSAPAAPPSKKPRPGSLF